MYIRVYMYIYVATKSIRAGQRCVYGCTWVYLYVYLLTHTQVYIVYMCVCMCARTHAHVVTVKHMHVQVHALCAPHAAAWERLTRVLATAIGAALFNKDGHETQDAVAPAGQGPQLCTAEHAHGQTGMSSRRSESKQRGRVSEGGSSGAHEPAATRRPRRAAGHGGGRAGQRGHHDSGWPRSIRAAAVLRGRFERVWNCPEPRALHLTITGW